MKTLKFALIAAIVACTMVSLANADGIKEKPKFKKVVNMTIQKAVHTPGLLLAMYDQIDKEEFLHNYQYLYIAEVVFQGNIYRIHGTREEWIKFFKIKGEAPINTNKGIGIN
jgi:hypothetical protein